MELSVIADTVITDDRRRLIRRRRQIPEWSCVRTLLGDPRQRIYDDERHVRGFLARKPRISMLLFAVQESVYFSCRCRAYILSHSAVAGKPPGLLRRLYSPFPRLLSSSWPTRASRCRRIVAAPPPSTQPWPILFLPVRSHAPAPTPILLLHPVIAL